MISAAATGGNVVAGSLIGGFSAGIAEGIGGEMAGAGWFQNLNPYEKFFTGLATRAGIGAVTGGITSEIVNGQFLQGFGQGASTAAYGFIFNWGFHGAAEVAFQEMTDDHVAGDQSQSLTQGQTFAVIKLFGGMTAIGIGALTLPEGAPVLAGGIMLTAEGGLLSAVEFGLGYDTGNIPNEWVICGQIVRGISGSWP